MAHADDLALIIRAACGDAQSLAALAQRNEWRLWMRLAALLALDPNPPPLALGAALALLDAPPESLRARARARADATLQALCEPDAAPLIAALRQSPATFRRAVAALETLDQTRAAPIFIVMDILDPSADKQPARLSADAAPPALRAAIPLLLAIAADDPKSAARAAGALWDVIDDDERAMIAHSAAQPPPRPSPLRGEGVGGGEARCALLDAVTRDPLSAAIGGGAVWNVLADDDRIMLARRAAQESGSAAALMERIGVEGWKIAPDDARQSLLAAVARDPWRAAYGSATVWTALADDDRIMLARSAAQDAVAAADLMARLGPDGWRVAPEDARQSLLAAVARDPWRAARGGGKVWTALADDDRIMLARSAAQNAESAADLMARLGPDGWRVAPEDARQSLLAAVARDPWHAARGGGKVWTALADDDRIMLARSAAQIPDAAALMERIGPDGWRITPDDARRALLDAVTRNPCSAVRAAAAVWTTLDDEQRAMLARRAAQHAESAADLLKRIGADGWRIAPEDARQILLESVTGNPCSAARAAAALIDLIGADGWRIAPEDARRALLDAVTRDPLSASLAGGKVWTALADDARTMIARCTAQHAESAADLMVRIGADGWRIAPEDACRMLLESVADAPKSAARSAAAVWTALADAERAMLTRSAAKHADAAADLLASIGADGAESLAPDARRVALNAAFCSPKQARRVAETLWQRMDAAERAAAARSISRDPNERDAWIEQAGAAAWEYLDLQQRVAALERMARVPDAAARIGVALWDALDDEQRSTIARGAAQPPPRPSPRRGEKVGDAAARLIAGVGERLDDAQIVALVRSALGGADVTRLAAQALADGLPWRAWMSLFLPAADDAVDVRDAWRAVIHRTPPHVAARLSPQRRPSR